MGQDDKERDSLDRREFLRKAAVTGAVAWAVPIIQTVTATPASARESGGSPPCFVSHCTAACVESADCGGQERGGSDLWRLGGALSGSGGNCWYTCKTFCEGHCTGPGGECPPGGDFCSPDCFDVNCSNCQVAFSC